MENLTIQGVAVRPLSTKRHSERSAPLSSEMYRVEFEIERIMRVKQRTSCRTSGAERMGGPITTRGTWRLRTCVPDGPREISCENTALVHAVLADPTKNKSHGVNNNPFLSLG